MPSVYHSCNVTDEAADALNAVKQHLEGIHQEFNLQLDTVAAAFSDLEGTPVAASAIIGTTTDNQVRWTAQVPGRAGNNISIQYVYLGPTVDNTGVLQPRFPSSSVTGNSITLYLSSDAAGTVTGVCVWDVIYWLSNPDVVDLVQAELIGTGLDVNVATPPTNLSGGKDRGMTASESAANDVAKVFGHDNYKAFMRDLEVPIIENSSDIAQYINSDDRYVTVNGKLLIVDGTNLLAINQLYRILGNDLNKTKEVLAQMTESLPTMVTTQNVSRVTYQVICNETQAVTTVSEQYRNLNTNVNTTIVANGGDLSSLNHYIFWAETVNSSQSAYDRLFSWGMPEDYIGDILAGETPDTEDWETVSVPEVLLVESLTLLDDLKFTNNELEELLALGLDGIKIPHKLPMSDRIQAIKNVLKARPATDDNGLRNRVKAPIAAIQGVDISRTTDDRNLAKELATRGKACARSSDRLVPENVGNFNIPGLNDLDLPNLPTAQLPDPSKKIESAYGALSGAVSFASGLFDTMVGSLTSMIGGILNKIMNVSSMVDNMFGNALAQCLLGTSQQATGAPEFTGVGQGGGNSIPQLDGILGGLPLPMSLLKDAFKALSISLDETITDAFETMMGLLQTPLCIIQSLLSSLSGFSLDGLFDICQDGKDPDNKCPPEVVQEVIDSSTELTSQLGTIPSLEDAPTTLPQYNTEEAVEEFTGLLKKTVTSSTDAVTRGIQEVMDEISQAVDTKIEMVEQFDKAIRELFGDARDTKETIDEDAESNTGCAPAVLGMFNDAVSDYL